MKKLLLLSLLLCSCGDGRNPSIIPTPNNSNQTSTTVNTNTTFSENEIAGLKFNKVSNANANLLNNSTGNPNSPNKGQQNAAPTSALGSAPRDAAVAPAPSGGDMASGRSAYGGYFTSQNPFEEYAVTDYQEAKTNGFTGTFLESYNTVVKPILKAWSADAKASSVLGNADQNGKGDENLNNWYSPYQWQFTYVSSSKKEVYSVFISSKETLVLRQKWSLKNLSDQNIKIDSSQAIKIFSDKVKDKNYNSEYDNNNLGPNSQPLYEIPTNNYWTFYLSQENSLLIWNINTNYFYPTVAPVQNDKAYTNTWYSGGYAKINAQTGELIYMNRPVKYTEIVQPPVDYRCDDKGCSSPGYAGLNP